MLDPGLTDRDGPRVLTIHGLVGAYASSRPDACAILAAGRDPLSFARLEDQFRYVGDVLRRMDIGVADRVAIILPDGVEAAVTILAVAANAVAAPLNPALPPRDFEIRLSALRANAVLLTRGSASAAEAAARSLRVPVLHLLPDTASPAGSFFLTGEHGQQGSSDKLPTADDAALLLFTSGTTAHPKLVPLKHRQLCLSAGNICSALQLGPADRCLGVMPLHHIHGLSTLLASLVSGGSYAATSAVSHEAVLAGLKDLSPTWFSASPAIHRAVLDHAERCNVDLSASSVRFIRSASAPMPPALVSDLESAFGVPVIEAYGMTEAGPQIASNRLPFLTRKRGSVGTAAGPEIAIMDEAGRILESGECGEVVIRGPSVIDGYDGANPGETFVGGWLCTGDRGYLDEDGYLFLTGRIDDEINRDGEKIAPARVEEALLEHPSIAEAAVFGVPHAVLGETVAAAIVLKPGNRLDRPVQQIREFASKRLAQFELPQEVVIVERMPFVPTEKFSRRELCRRLGLAEAGGTRPALASLDKTASRNATERCVAEVFAEVLKCEPPGIFADFFNLGGHSLAAMQVLSRLQQIFRIRLPIDAVFLSPTVAQLAGRIGEQIANMVADGIARLESPVLAPARPEDTEIPRRQIAGPAPLAFSQQRVYFLDQVGLGAAYNMSASLWLTGELDERAIALALNEIVRRHDILRTTFLMRGDQQVQVIAPPVERELEVIDLSARATEERLGEAMRLATQEARQDFHLESGPLFCTKLVRLGHSESVLLMTMHHIVSDGWSIGVLYEELKQLYEAYRDHRPCLLPELKLQYADFAAWQHSQVEEGRLEREALYWRRRLDHLPPACTFPTDRLRPAVQSHHGAIEQIFIEGDLVDRLRSLAWRENTTLFMMLLAAFKTLLFRHNGQEDCVVGVPIANRRHSELEPLIGFFANTLVMRSSLDGDPTFLELLARVRAGTLEAFAHQDMPLERIVQDLRIARDLSRMPLFQVMFAFQNLPETRSHASSVDLFCRPSFDLAPGLTARPIRVDGGTAKFDITVYLSETDEGLAVAWQFNTDLFERSTIQRLAWQFQTLLKGISAHPQRKLSELPLLSEADSRQLEIDWNRTETRRLHRRNFVQLFQAVVERTPNALAVVDRCGALTYRQLNERSNQLGRYFQGLSLGQERLCGVCLPRNLDMVAVLLGVWKAGAAFLPLDPDYPAERIAFMLRDAGVSLLVTRTSLLPKLAETFQSLGSTSGTPLDTVCIDASQMRVADESPRDLEATPPADALAYVIYTSGSTGTPKGVMITHGNVCHYAQALVQAVGITADDRYLHTASFSFSSSVRQFAAPLSCGATVAIASGKELHDPQALFETIREREISVVDLVPSFSGSCLRVLLSLEPSARAHLLDNHVRLMLSASEPLPSALVESWRRICRPATTFINMFGQTETTGIVMTYPIPIAYEAGAIVPIGRPIANTQAYVLNGSRRLVPIGVCGELYVGGNGVGRGYVNQPELTMNSFVANPFDQSGGGRLYRTGDLARYRPDGVIETVGRVDEQIKIRGFRIEPSEIEAAIRMCPGVRECVLIAADDAYEQDRIGCRKSLVAFIVGDDLHADEASLEAVLRDFLKRKLPDYMLPHRTITLPRFPRTPNGKIDLQSLLARIAQTAASATPLLAEQLEAHPKVERALTEIWRKVLRREGIKPSDNFFDLGGNSRLSINVMFEAKQAGLNITLGQFYQNQTIYELARVAVDSRPVASHGPRYQDIAAEGPTPVVTIESLRAFGVEVLTRVGLHPEGAAIVTEVQLEASLRGQPTHDMVSIPRYATRIAAGKINASPGIRIERETSNSALVDGDNGPGQWVATVAMDIAMRKARERGIGIVSVRRSNHFGAAGNYVWEATKRGLIGLCTTNGPLVLAPTGGVTPTFGNNPLAVGIPAGRHLPILLDIAISVAPRGKIGLAVAEGRPIPQGWILDRFGRPSTDLADLAAGLGVPIGGHKGYGLALVLEVLAGVLSGAGFAADHRPDILLASSDGPDYGHLFISLDPERFMPASVFAARVDRLIEETKRGERAPGIDEILIPGEKELKARERCLKEGVRLRPSTYRALVAYGRENQLSTRLVLLSQAAAPA